MGPAHFPSYRKFWEPGKHAMVRKISGAEHMCSCLMSLPFTQADTDYCSADRPACSTAKSMSAKASRSTDPSGHSAHAEQVFRYTAHPVHIRLTASC